MERGAGKKKGAGGRLQASFTLEAALIVPLLLAVIFMTLQLALYLHDSVWAEAWVRQRAWQLSLAAEGGEAETLPRSQTAEEGNRKNLQQDEEENHKVAEDALELPLPVLRLADYAEGEGGGEVWFEASFNVNTVAAFGRLIYDGQPLETSRRAAERVIDAPGFLRIAGAILEGGE